MRGGEQPEHLRPLTPWAGESPADQLIRPNLKGYGPGDLKKMDELIQLGYDATMAELADSGHHQQGQRHPGSADHDG